MHDRRGKSKKEEDLTEIDQLKLEIKRLEERNKYLEIKNLEKKYGFTITMSRVGKCLDHQPIESFWGVMKSEY